MGGESEIIDRAQARSALSWWLEAGVDAPVAEEARNWLKPVVRQAAAPPPPRAESRPAHGTLEQFRLWLEQSDELPMRGASPKRVLPSGVEQAAVMLLAEMPSAEDAAAGQPLSGPCRALAEAMLAAIGVTPDHAYFASLSCFHAPGAKLRGADLEACAEIAREHIRLARPQRLLLLGEAPCLALLGKGVIAARGHVHKVEGVRTVATFHPRHLIHRTLDKALAWQDLLLLTEGEA